VTGNCDTCNLENTLISTLNARGATGSNGLSLGDAVSTSTIWSVTAQAGSYSQWLSSISGNSPSPPPSTFGSLSCGQACVVGAVLGTTFFCILVVVIVYYLCFKPRSKMDESDFASDNVMTADDCKEGIELDEGTAVSGRV